MMRKLANALPATLPILLLACGGGPDLNQVKADFNDPSGSVKSKEAMVASSSNLDASTGATVVLGGGVPGVSLTATGKERGFSQINIRRNWEPRAIAARDFLNGIATQEQTLRASQTDGGDCFSSPEAQEAYNNIINDIAIQIATGKSKVSGAAKYTQDLSTCSAGALSGRMTIAVKIEAEQTGANAGRFAFTVKYTADNVCELNTEERTCVTGDMIMEAEAVGMENFGSLTFTSAWQLSATWNEGSVPRSANLKGGIRSAFEGDGTSGSAFIEILVYVNTPEGEWSYVWKAQGSFNGINGMVTIECRGSDGSAMCTIDQNGGMCSSSDGSSLSWTSADEEALDPSWFE